MAQSYNSLAGQRVQRMEALSDGVFAIALTLLILDIKVPVSSLIHSESDLITALCALTPKLLAYFLSFMTIGIFWGGQSVQFQYITKSDRHLHWLNLFFLLFVSTLPFTTAFLSEFITYRTAIFVYWLNILLLGLSLYFHWSYAHKHDFLHGTKEQLFAAHKAIRSRIIIAQSLYAVGALCCFINTYLSISFIIAVQGYYALGIGMRKRSRS